MTGLYLHKWVFGVAAELALMHSVSLEQLLYLQARHDISVGKLHPNAKQTAQLEGQSILKHICRSLSRSLYHIMIYQLYRYFGYTIHIVSFNLVTRYFKLYIFVKFRIFWSLKYPNSHQICGHIKFFGLKPDKMYHWYILNIASCVSWYLSIASYLIPLLFSHYNLI